MGIKGRVNRKRQNLTADERGTTRIWNRQTVFLRLAALRPTAARKYFSRQSNVSMRAMPIADGLTQKRALRSGRLL